MTQYPFSTYDLGINAPLNDDFILLDNREEDIILEDINVNQQHPKANTNDT
jgi:hypothetical protein